MSSVARSNAAEVCNPVLTLRNARRLRELPPEARDLLREILLELREEANVKAEDSWRKSKGPIACYWRAVSTYAFHLARILRGPGLGMTRKAPPRTTTELSPAAVAPTRAKRACIAEI